MSTPTYPGPMGSFDDGVFIPHRDSAMTEENTSSTATPTPTPKSKERSATPEWYQNPYLDERLYDLWAVSYVHYKVSSSKKCSKINSHEIHHGFCNAM